MRCARCGLEHREGFTVCAECGAALAPDAVSLLTIARAKVIRFDFDEGTLRDSGEALLGTCVRQRAHFVCRDSERRTVWRFDPGRWRWKGDVLDADGRRLGYIGHGDLWEGTVRFAHLTSASGRDWRIVEEGGGELARITRSKRGQRGDAHFELRLRAVDTGVRRHVLMATVCRIYVGFEAQ